jgi:thiamine kinase-like enzyme
MTDLVRIQDYLNSDRELHTALGIAADAVLPLSALAQGEYNLNYRFRHPVSGQELVLRVNMGSQLHLQQQISYEAAALQALAASGRTPQVHYLDDSKRRLEQGILVEDFLLGRPLCYETDLDEAARVLADIHAQPCPEALPLLRPAKPLRAIVAECEQLVAAYRSSRHQLPEAEPYFKRFFADSYHILADEKPVDLLARHIISTELNSENFIIEASGYGWLVDWEKPVAGEVAQDLAHFLVPTTTAWKTETILDQTQRQDFLERYSRAVAGRFALDQLQRDLSRYLPITCLRALSWCAMAYTEYSEPGRRLRNESTFAKIRQFLTPDFLTFITDEFFAVQTPFI